MINTAIRLRTAAIDNIKQYCINNPVETFEQVYKELCIEADEYNLKLPIDYYKDLYNLTLKL